MPSPHGSPTERLLARLPLALALLFAALFVAAPLLAMVLPTLSVDGSFSLARYATILASEQDRAELLNSVELGLGAAAVAVLLGGGHAWLTHRTDLPGGRWLAPLGVAPLAVPPILVAMGFADFTTVSGFWACVVLLGCCYAPFVAVLAGRGLRSIDGRTYEAALLCRGRAGAERMLLRGALPELLAGAFLAFLFAISEHGVPEFLTVKGKTWHTYAEGVFRRWTRRATGVTEDQLASPVVAALPLLLLAAIALAIVLRVRARASDGTATPLPVRPLGHWRWPALLLPATYLTVGAVVPVVIMGLWAAGSTQRNEPISFAIMRRSFQHALEQAGGDLWFTILNALLTTVLLLAVAVPLARLAARRFGWVDHLAVIPLATPAVLLTIGFVHAFNGPHVAALYDATFDFYDSHAILVTAYAARLLPFGVLLLSSAVRRIPKSQEEAALFADRGPLARGLRIHLPPLLPALASLACLLFVLALRELDTAVVLPSGNDTIVRRLSNVVHFGGEDVGGALALLLLLVAVLPPVLGTLLRGRRLDSLS
ncbi:MAG: iron ABC transporter permease [Planctomycetes bacterium]|nr:iron ABC transporter permease [Planctomycetota bacterium]MCB9885485.1 iron ABC transporter permease [Planctomycetota bacterium]